MRPIDRQPHDSLTGRSQAKDGQRPDRRQRTGVLVVDDDHPVRVVVHFGLERSGFAVWSASNGHEAIEVYREHCQRIAAVVLDVRMPGLDGPQTLDALRLLNPNIFACFMSGDMGDYGSEELLRRGANHVLAKPFHLDILAGVLGLCGKAVPHDLSTLGKTMFKP